jgi:hypothetical protein
LLGSASRWVWRSERSICPLNSNWSGRYYAGMTLDYRFPIGLPLTLVPVVVAAGLLSAIIPAESAVRGSLVEALENE